MNLHPKAAATGLGGSLSIIILWAIGYAVTVPPEVAGGFVGVVCFACAWLAPWFATHRPGPAPPPAPAPTAVAP